MPTAISAKEMLDLLPKDGKIQIKKTQNPDCNSEGHFCGEFRGTDACLIPIFKKNEKTGETELVKLKPCKKTGLKGFTIEG